MAALDPFSGTLGWENAAHLLRRATFGSTKTDITNFSTKNVSQAMEALFPVNPVMPNPPFEPGKATTWINPKAPDDANQELLTQYFMAWHLEQMRNSGTNILERITYFLHTHLPVRRTLVTSSEMLYNQNRLFRHYAFGSFKELFRKICVDNAMLIYLDNGINDKDEPNENFAREMFELYSIGRGDQDGEGSYTNYTEEDVVAAAKVLTGWEVDATLTNVDSDTGIPIGKLKTGGAGEETLANRHHSGKKTFSSKFGSVTIEPYGSLTADKTTIIQANKELDDLIDLIFNQNETARFIIRKIYRHFVYYKIDDYVEQNIIIPLAASFKSSAYHIPTAIKTLLSSQHFYDVDLNTADDNIKAALIKSPLEILLGTARMLESTFPANYYPVYLGDEGEGSKSGLINLLTEQGINFYEPYDVAGYDAYYQFPAFSRNWITPNYLAYRYKTSDYLIYNAPFEGVSMNIQIDLPKWVKKNVSDPGDPDVVVKEILDVLFPYDLESISPERLKYFRDVFLLPDEADYQWSNAWTAYDVANPGGTAVQGVKTPLDRLVSKLIQTPEYQLN